MPTITSTFLGLDWKDFAKGALVAILSTVLPIIYDTLNAGSFSLDWKHIGGVGLSAFVAYIMKNLLTGPEVKISVDKTTAKLFKAGKLDAKVFDPKAEKNA
jgi:hypothetical protein